MKRSEMLLKLQELYNEKHAMMEKHYITPYEFLDIALTLMEEEGMRPPYDASQDDRTDTIEWEDEQ